MKEFRGISFYFLLSVIKIVCNEDYKLTVLHTNDVHAHIEEFNKYGTVCSDGRCFGGVARRHTIVENIRNSTENVILLDGGDQFSGTLWFTHYRGQAAVLFMNYTRYDAMAIGNHEFDNGPENLREFMEKANFSIVSANTDVSKDPNWPRPNNLFTPSTVIERGGRKIGVIGFTIAETKWLSKPGEYIEFTDEVSSVKAEAARLKGLGIDILIGLGHAGIEMDKKIAKNVRDLDLVVGGHSNTFLYNGNPPSVEKPEGPYPVFVKRDDGSSCPVVQDFTYGKYLGKLDLIFDNQGNLKSAQGNPIILNTTVKQDENVLEIVQQMSKPILASRNKSVGRSLVFLQGDRKVCRVQECNLGNLITDAIVKMNQKTPDESEWASVVLAIWNGGGIRSGDIDKRPNEQITMEEINSILPFGNSADIIEIKGKHLKDAFENGVSNLPLDEGKYPQVSGFKVYFDSTKPVGKRIIQVNALCSTCRVPKYEPIEMEKIYKVVVSDYLVNGGDGYKSLKNYIKKHPGDAAVFFLEKYIRQESPISPTLEGRSVDLSKERTWMCDSTNSATIYKLSLRDFLIIMALYSINVVVGI